MKKYVLTVTLNPAIDKIVSIPNFQMGKDFVQRDASLSAGGKGINVARALKNLGVPALATGLIGGSAGEFIRKSLNREHIANDFLTVSFETRISLTINDPQRNAEVRILDPGTAVGRRDLEGFKKKFKLLLKNAHCAVLAGRAPQGRTDHIYAELIAIARRENIATFLDTHGRALMIGVRAKPFAIKPNLKEAQEALGERLDSLPKIRRAVAHFHSLGVQRVFISLAGRGAVASDGREMFWVRPPVVAVKSQVGCGDSFVGGCVYGFIKKMNLAQVAAFASATGTANTQTATPGKISRSIINRYLKQIKLKVL